MAENIELFIEDEITEKMKPIMINIAEELKKATEISEKGNNIVLRFHNDADGIAGALAIYKALKPCKIFSYQNKGVTYSPGDALTDIRLLQDSVNPLVVLSDFATNEESREARKLIKNAGIKLIIIDHHPTEEEIAAEAYIYLSPWEVGGDSFYTAGWMACEIAKLLGLNKEEAKYLYQKVSNEITSLMTCLEGHASFFEKKILKEVIKDYDGLIKKIEKYRKKRRTKRIKPLKVKMDQYIEGEKFVKAVYGEFGTKSSRLIFENLPTIEEIKNPNKYIEKLKPLI